MGKLLIILPAIDVGRKDTIPINASNHTTLTISTPKRITTTMVTTTKSLQLTKMTHHKPDPPNKEQDTYKSLAGIYLTESSQLKPSSPSPK